MAIMFLRETIKAYKDRDPAARSSLEVVFCYPGVHAVVAHKLSHALWVHNLYFLGRLSSHISRWLTGIEIHPAAKLGRRLVIDHGMGVVIGETAEIGDDCYLYHQVTLGVARTMDGKRHPTVGSNVIIGAGAKVLGPITVGDNARIGSNAVVVDSVPANTTVVGIPARPVDRKRPHSNAFDPYGMPCDDSPDPVLRDLERLRGEVAALGAQLARLVAEACAQRDGPVRPAGEPAVLADAEPPVGIVLAPVATAVGETVPRQASVPVGAMMPGGAADQPAAR